MLDTGSSADPGVQPPGWLGGANNHARGHLLANWLGGSGTDERNLMTLHHRNANSPVMRDFEALIYRAVDAGKAVNYRVTPIYNESGMPTHVAISVRGSNGFSLDVTVVNQDALAAPAAGGGAP